MPADIDTTSAPPDPVASDAETAAAASDAQARRVTHARVVRDWLRYGVGFTVAAALVLGFIGWTWAHGETRHAHSHPTTTKARALATGQLATTLTPAWQTTDHAAIGDAVDLDVVVTYGGHTVSGHDARTGKVRWTYTRTDRRLCAALVQSDTVMAVYAHDGICDEATGLDDASGKRVWTRTLLGGQPVQMSVGQQHYLFSRPDVVYLVRPYHPEPTDEFDFNYTTTPKARPGCSTDKSQVGTQAVLIADTCTTASSELLTMYAPDSGGTWKQTWQVARNGRTPLSADGQLVALSKDGRSLQVLNAKNGSVTDTLPLPHAARAPSAPAGIELSESDVQLMSVAGGTVAISTGDKPAVLWQKSDGAVNDTDAGLYVARAGGVAAVEPQTGRERQVAVAVGLPADARLLAVGTGLLADSAAGVTVYR